MGQPAGLMVACAGGLDLISTTPELVKTPGAATQMINFEPGLTSGYRRINGFTKFGTEEVDGTTGTVLGVVAYADGIVACKGDAIYFSQDGDTWTQINFDTWNTGSGQSDPTNGTELARTGTGRYQFEVYEGNTEYGELLILDGVGYMAYFKITGTGGSRKYYYRNITTATYGAPAAPQWVESYKDHVIIGGDITNPETVYWSDAFDPVTFTGGTSGSIKTLDKITGIKSWRDRLFVFGYNSISEIVDINGVVTLNTVSRNIGCIDGFSIQEFGGEIIWLALDGLRNLSGTDKIDDIGLGSISSKISPLIQDIVNNITDYTVSSLVIRNKSQYRLYYSTGSVYKGIVGTYKVTPNGLGWEWGELLGIPVACTSNYVNFNLSGVTPTAEAILHGGFDGYVYIHDYGDTMNGSDIEATYSTPEIDLGDIGTKKSLHWVELFLKVEGINDDIRLHIQYDFNSERTHQPDPYVVMIETGISLYGTGLYGTATYSGLERIAQRVRVAGSGYSFKLIFTIFGQDPAVSLSGFYIRSYEGKYL